MKKILVLVLVGCVSFVVAVGAVETDKGGDASETKKEFTVQTKGMKKSDSSDWGISHSARAVIEATVEDSKVTGRVDFVETGGGLQVVVTLSNVTPAGKHGIHVHENGSCDEGGKAAGGHFNPGGKPHGFLVTDGHDKAHVGDMGNIEINDKGEGALVVFLPDLSLTEGKNNITARAVILHAKEDNFGQPTGNAGGRIGCGEIMLNK